MRILTSIFGRGARGRPLPRTAAAAALALGLAACDTEGLLEVEDPDVTLPEALFDPSNLAALRATVVGDFGVAFGGSGQTNGLVINSGLLADEFYHSGTFGQNRELDKRGIAVTNSAVGTATRNLYRARRSALLGAASFGVNRPASFERAEMHNLLGYTYIFFAENYCSGVPFSDDVNGNFTYGAPETRDAVYGRAIVALDSALAVATAANAATPGADAVAQQRLARMGKARALLGQNQYAAAAALVADIPTSFVYEFEFSDNSGRQNNGIWGLNHSRREIGLSSAEGGVGVVFRPGSTTTQNAIVSVDPRTTWSFREGAADTRSRHFFQHKYDTQGDPIALASGIEARLIEAEAALNRGNSAAYLPILNSLRASVGLADLADPGTAAGRVSQFFAERALWLFGQGQRLSDLRRLVRQYGRAEAQVFPSGAYTRPGTGTLGDRPDGTYGTDKNFPVVFDEQNNPSFTQCIDRDA